MFFHKSRALLFGVFSTMQKKHARIKKLNSSENFGTWCFTGFRDRVRSTEINLMLLLVRGCFEFFLWHFFRVFLLLVGFVLKKKLGRVVLLVHFVVSLEQFCCTNLLRITSVFVVPSIVYKLCVLFPDSLYYLTFFQHKHFFYYIWSFRKSLVVFHHFSYLSAFCVHKPRREKSHK